MFCAGMRHYPAPCMQASLDRMAALLSITLMVEQAGSIRMESSTRPSVLTAAEELSQLHRVHMLLPIMQQLLFVILQWLRYHLISPVLAHMFSPPLVVRR